MNSELVKAVLQDELERNRRLLSRYKKEVENLPKGSIYIRNIGNHQYIYLNYRDGKKVISKFIGKKENLNIEALQIQLEKRKEYKLLLKKLKQEQKELLKVLK